MSSSVDTAVRHRADTDPSGIAFVDPHQTLTWRELDESADRVAQLLADHGVGPGARVALLVQNSAAYPPVLLGVWRRRAALASLNWRLPAADLRAAAESIGVKHLIVGAEFAELAPQSGIPVTILDPQLPFVDGREADPASVLEPAADDEAMIYFTSGTTGLPKAVSISHDAVEGALQYRMIHDFDSDTRSLVVPPIFHAAGAMWLNYGLASGATQFFVDDASPAGMVDALQRHEITHAILVPALIHAVVAHLENDPVPLPTLGHVGYGASPIALPLLRKAVALLDCDFCQVYGMSESGGGISFLRPEDHALDAADPRHLTSIGRPGPGVEVRVREIGGGDDLPIGESGELWWRAPSMMREYIGREADTNRLLVGGWFNSRDVGRLDAEGYVFVEGRSDDMIQTGSENVHPNEVEAVIAQVPGVSECAVFGAPDDRWGEVVVAAVVASSPALTVEDIAAHCREHLAGYKCPKQIRLIQTLPRTATGKVLRRDLAQGVLTGL